MASPRTLTLALLLLAAAPATGAQPPPVATAAGVIAAAHREGRVVVYSVTDREVAEPLLADFAELYPRIQLDYRELRTAELYEQYTREVREGRVEADVLWSPAMDLQMKLANDGLAQAYESPEAVHLPPWASWRHEAFGTTLEPFVFVHDGRRLPDDRVPQTHADLVRMLEAGPVAHGKVAAYDPERSAIGYLLLTQDSRIDPGFADAVRAYGRAGIERHATTSRMIDRVLSGDLLLAFNVNGSYALQAQRQHPSLGVVYPRDYVLAASRIALITRAAPHPSAARVFLDYLLSHRGQQVLAQRCSLFSIRPDVEGATSAAALSRALGARLKPIHVGPSLLVYLDASKRVDFLRRWKSAFAGR
ncbi:MAG: ABC transporter substrate-binding protein [Deltaproteobacteria bacterium]|nr:ABC transporter substrate-binding protein [Deltaproteobacteria bacterium]